MILSPLPGLQKAVRAAAVVGTAGMKTQRMVVMAMTWPGARHWVHRIGKSNC